MGIAFFLIPRYEHTQCPQDTRILLKQYKLIRITKGFRFLSRVFKTGCFSGFITHKS